jgi:hypothetical protein
MLTVVSIAILVLAVLLVAFRLIDILVGLLLAAAGLALLWWAAQSAATSLPWETIAITFLALFGIIVTIRLVAAVIITREMYGRKRRIPIGTPRKRGRARDSGETKNTY